MTLNESGQWPVSSGQSGAPTGAYWPLATGHRPLLDTLFLMILVLRHEPFEHLGHFAGALDRGDMAYRYHDLGEPLEPGTLGGVIIMGGPMSANDSLPGLTAELRLIEDALRNDIPVLGVCLGSQLIAKALGARVYRKSRLEIGWHPVWLTAAGRSDALFSGLRSPTTFFHWHSETFDLPWGAEWLAYSEQCPHQAYRYGRCAYGIQFHPEITGDMVEDWCSQPVNCGDIQTLDSPIDPWQTDSGPAAGMILKQWLDLF